RSGGGPRGRIAPRGAQYLSRIMMDRQQATTPAEIWRTYSQCDFLRSFHRRASLHEVKSAPFSSTTPRSQIRRTPGSPAAPTVSMANSPHDGSMDGENMSKKAGYAPGSAAESRAPSVSHPQHCEFRMRGHYHCLRPGCYFVTNITTKLPWHVKKHEKAERRAANGFKYFTKREECGRMGCKYNQLNSHFHCIREGCQFSFLLKHQMTSHARKHMRRMLGKNFDRVPSQQPGLNSGYAGLMDDTDDYMDYMGGASPLGLSSESSNQDRSCSSTPVGNEGSPAGNTISIPTATGAKKRFWIIEDMSPYGKRSKTASSRKMLDEGMMLEGFRRYDLYENCKDLGCQFSLKVTHYHCTRENCGYKFCGRTHMYKHAQHHDRVDNLVLDDFKRFKSTLSCSFADCQFSGNSTHFHCLRCGFRCTDSTKVTAHRKHHGKQDVISAAGFCQFSSSADCEVADCKYKLKCSHFHCTFPECRHTVVGMSQMDSHKRKHEKQERGEPTAASPGQE
ncbi:unnamed protein product, partial [Lota lota]